MEEDILKKLSNLNLEGSFEADLYIKRLCGFVSKKNVYKISTKLNKNILKEFLKESINSSREKIESILLVIHYSYQGELTHDILLSPNLSCIPYEGLI